MTIVFYDSGPEGFINTYYTGPYSVGLSGSFPNGSLWSADIDASNGVTITTSSDGGTSGKWTGSDYATFVSVGLVNYDLTIDAPSIGVRGNISFTSVSLPWGFQVLSTSLKRLLLIQRKIAPAHYPCSPNVGGSDEAIVPHVFWSNAVPDALAVVALTVGDTELYFTDGVGYHDKNWGDLPFVETVSSWYWGHAHVGPYSIVWFDAIDSAGTEHFSGYVAEAGSILESSCGVGAVSVRPWGVNDEYPPLASTGVMQGLEATFKLEDGSILAANITTGTVVINNGVYVRTLGSVEAGIIGGTIYTGGRTLFEEFKFSM